MRKLILCLALAGCAPQQSEQDILDAVAQDAEAQFKLVSEHGTPADKCVYAGVAAAAQLQAKNEERYRYWKAIEGMYCTSLDR